MIDGRRHDDCTWDWEDGAYITAVCRDHGVRFTPREFDE